MREIFTKNWSGERKLDNPDSYHDRLRQEPHRKGVVYQEIPVAGHSFLASGLEYVQNRDEVVRETAEVLQETVEAFYPVAVAELQRSGVTCTEEELRKNYLRFQDFSGRLVIEYDPVHNFSETAAIYLPESHRIVLNYARFASADFNYAYAPVDRPNFIKTLVHELIHFISAQKIVLKKEAAGKSSVGYSRSADKDKGAERLYTPLNEAVTERLAIELAPQVLTAIGQPSEFKKSYLYERQVLDVLIAGLAQYTKVSAEIVWQSFKAGMLKGSLLESKEVVKSLQACFGPDVVENFLSTGFEKNPRYDVSAQAQMQPGESILAVQLRLASAALQKRWDQNGALSL